MAGVESLIDELRAIVGDAHVLTDDDMVSGYTVDWTRRFAGSTPMVVRPGTTEQTAAVLTACSAAGMPVVPQGGNTGLVGGSVPLAGEVVLSMARMNWIDPVDVAARQVTVGAGATLASVQDAARSADLAFGVDIGARASATIGGMVATNAGGIHVVRHGAMRAQVVGLEAVLSDGRTISRLSGLEKDNTGYDLAGLLCGSEGTLAIITAARLRLVAALDGRIVSIVGCETAAAAVALAAAVRGFGGISAIEAFWQPAARLVSAHLGIEPPVGDPPIAVLIEVASGPDLDDTAARLADLIDGIGADVDAAIVATGPAGQLNLWRYRESIAEAISHHGVPIKLDVTLPAANLASFVDTVPAVVSGVAPGSETFLFGHLGDGNVHVNILGAEDVAEAVENIVLEQVAAMGGSISAEHGIGTAKTRWLHLARSAAELRLFEDLRRVWDPSGILNPSVLRPPVGAEPAS